jgi:hypothetical protein
MSRNTDNIPLPKSPEGQRSQQFHPAIHGMIPTNYPFFNYFMPPPVYQYGYPPPPMIRHNFVHQQHQYFNFNDFNTKRNAFFDKFKELVAKDDEVSNPEFSNRPEIDENIFVKQKINVRIV